MAAERALAAQIVGARAQLKTAQINLGYTEIRAAIDGKITARRSPRAMWSRRAAAHWRRRQSGPDVRHFHRSPTAPVIDLRNRYAARGGYDAVVIKLRLPDGQMYGQDGKLDYVAPTVGETTDTIAFRGVVANPVFPGMRQGQPGSRELDGRRIRHRAARRCRADHGSRNSACRRVVGPAGRLRLRGRRPEQSPGPTDPARAVDPFNRGR